MLKFYYQTLTRMVTSPGKFFREKEASFSGYHTLGFLVFSTLFFTGIGLLSGPRGNAILIGGLALINEVGMAVLAAAVGYMLMVMLVGRRAGFTRIFNVVALCSGTTMLIAWVPYLLGFAVVWKWGLIATGLAAGIGLSKKEAGVIVVLAVLVLFAIFRSLLPLVHYLKGAVS